MKFIHIVTDDKFVDGAISLFEEDDRVNNSYVIIGEEAPFKYIKSNLVSFLSAHNALDVINSYNVVFVHSLPAIPLDILLNIKKEVKVVWLAWGYDLYEKPYQLIPINLYGPETKKLFRFNWFYDLLHWKNYQDNCHIHSQVKSAIRRFDYFSGVFPYEYDLLKKYNKDFKANPIDFYYGSVNFFIPENISDEIKHGKKNIIINNSGNVTGNHLDVIKALSKIKIDNDAKIIIPLSYGAPVSYANKVESEAEKVAPGQIVSLRKYLSLEEYLGLVSNCRTAVFAHERQQASDNIFMQLQYGARVFMSETSYAYKYLKEIGLKIYSLQSDLNLFNVVMPDEDILNNRQILSSMYSSKQLIDRVRNIVTIMIRS